jgi:hypothetical protein
MKLIHTVSRALAHTLVQTHTRSRTRSVSRAHVCALTYARSHTRARTDIRTHTRTHARERARARTPRTRTRMYALLGRRSSSRSRRLVAWARPKPPRPSGASGARRLSSSCSATARRRRRAQRRCSAHGRSGRCSGRASASQAGLGGGPISHTRGHVDANGPRAGPVLQRNSMCDFVCFCHFTHLVRRRQCSGGRAGAHWQGRGLPCH